MKKIFFFFFLQTVLAYSAIAQITLSFDDLNPKNSDTMTWSIVPSSLGIAPLEGAGVHQNYLKIQPSSAVASLVYNPTEESIIPLATRYYTESAATGIFSIMSHIYESVSNDTIKSLGYETQADSLSLSTITLGVHDKIVFPKKAHVLANPLTILPFPLTANTSWQSSARFTHDFKLTILGAGYDNSEGNYIQNRNSTTMVAGWGTTSLSVNGKASSPVSGLLLKESVVEKDSFLVDNSPISDDLLAILGLQQGVSRSKNIYSFYRLGQEKPLFICKTDANNTVTSFYLDNDTTISKNLPPRLISPIPDTLVATNKLVELNYISRHFTDGDSNDFLYFDIKQANGDTIPAWLYVDSGSGSIKGEATDSITLSFIIKVKDLAGDSCADTAVLAFKPGVGINPLSINPLSVYPQPCSNTVTISIQNRFESEKTANLINSYGQVVRRFNLAFGVDKQTIDVSGLKDGVYYLAIANSHWPLTKVIITND